MSLAPVGPGRIAPTAASPDQTLAQVLAKLNPALANFLHQPFAGFQINVEELYTPPPAVPGKPGRYAMDSRGLVADVRIDYFSDLGVARQSVSLTNEGTAPSQPIGEVNAFFLPLKVRLKDCPQACHLGGGLTDGYYPPRAWQVHDVAFGKARTCEPKVTEGGRWFVGKRWCAIASNADGRSSNPDFPLLMFSWDGGGRSVGLWASMEWSGRWDMAAGTQANVHWGTINGKGGFVPHEGLGEDWDFVFRGGPRGIRNMVLQPGETVQLPTVHVGVFAESGGAVEQGFNNVRRYVVNTILPDVEGKPEQPAIGYSHWFGIQQNVNDALMRKQVDRAAELGLEYFEIDAGWFGGSTENFGNGVGNWERVDDKKFPNGLEGFAQYVKSKGLKMGLWFEPERGREGSDWVTQHPDWYWGDGPSYDLDLTQTKVQDGLIEMLSKWVTRLDLRYLRWDNNQMHGPFWDKVDPTGKVQFAHMQGLYRVFDTLLQRHPNLLIENCASGGQRTDFGTLRRAGSSVISDHAEDPHVCRIMQTGGARFLPGSVLNSSIAVGPDDGEQAVGELEVMSRLAGAITLNGHIANWTPKQAKMVRKHLDGFRKYRHLLMKDFYALTPYPRSSADWDVAEFTDPATREAVLLAYRMRGQEAVRTIRLKALDAARQYEITDPFSGKKGVVRSGQDLMEKGLRIALDKESAAVRQLKPMS